MPVIGQDDNGLDGEWPFLAHGAKSVPQHIHGSGGSKNGPATGSHHREEKAAAWLECASVSHDFGCCRITACGLSAIDIAYFPVLSDYGLRPNPTYAKLHRNRSGRSD